MGFGALAIVETGAFDTSASTPHSFLVAWATHTTMIHSVRLRSRGVVPPARFTGDDVRAGFRLYEADCLSCHGGPGIARGRLAAGMNPTPPYLLDAARKWPPAQLYQIVRNGVKMTGMPAWRGVRSDREMWSLVAFLDALPALTPQAYLQMRREAGDANPPAAPPPTGAQRPDGGGPQGG
jgi:mono/diheme cytochrome c family protein